MQPRPLTLGAKACLKFSVHLKGETDKEMNYYPTVRQECCWMNSTCFRNANPHAKRILIKPGFQLDRNAPQSHRRAWDQRCLSALVSRCYAIQPQIPTGRPSQTCNTQQTQAAEQLCTQPFTRDPQMRARSSVSSLRR